MLFTKSIYKPKSLEDGLRISVMSRHTLDDGLTPDPEIILENYDIHAKILAPPGKLVGAYYRKELSFEDYIQQYVLTHLSKPVVISVIECLAEYALRHDVTLLCKEDDATKCHRWSLAENCKIYQSDLKIIHV